MRISDWSSDVCSSDLLARDPVQPRSRAMFKPARCQKLHAHANAQERNAAREYAFLQRSEERRVGKSVSVRVDLGGRRINKKKTKDKLTSTSISQEKKKKTIYTIKLKL